MASIDFNAIVEQLKQAKEDGLNAATKSGQVTPDLLGKLSMLSLYCDTGVSNINAAASLYNELVKADVDE